MNRFDLLIKDCMILPISGPIIPNGVIGINDGVITLVGSSARGNKGEIEISAKKMVALPGFINTHSHAAMSLFRGIGEDSDLETWLKKIIWPIEARLSPLDVYWGSMLACLEMIKSGTTCFADMYYYEEEVARAVEASGMRAVLGQGLIETYKKEENDKLFNRMVDFVKKYNGKCDGRIKTSFAPHALYTVSLETLSKIAEESRKTGTLIQIHLAESLNAVKNIETEYGVSPVKLLDRINFLGENVLAAHCIHLHKEDMRILAERGVKVSYNPISNMKTAVGIAKISELMKLGVCVSLGTDSAASNNNLDMVSNMKFASLLQKVHYCDPTVLSAQSVMKIATINGAVALGLDREIGTIEVGKKADIVLINLDKPHLIPLNNPYAAIVYSANGEDVDTVIVNGKILMEHREVKTLDEQLIKRKACRVIEKLLEKTAF
ncbi:MAG: amidohydrolase [Candidatus Odinarchaeia archaeon]